MQGKREHNKKKNFQTTKSTRYFFKWFYKLQVLRFKKVSLRTHFVENFILNKRHWWHITVDPHFGHIQKWQAIVLHVLKVKEILRFSCADPEVRHSNTEESILYLIRSKYNLFWRSAYGFQLKIFRTFVGFLCCSFSVCF